MSTFCRVLACAFMSVSIFFGLDAAEKLGAGEIVGIIISLAAFLAWPLLLIAESNCLQKERVDFIFPLALPVDELHDMKELIAECKTAHPGLSIGGNGGAGLIAMNSTGHGISAAGSGSGVGISTCSGPVEELHDIKELVDECSHESLTGDRHEADRRTA